LRELERAVSGRRRDADDLEIERPGAAADLKLAAQRI
jgi:hypothetical protein